jgi:hypothetical protein
MIEAFVTKWEDRKDVLRQQFAAAHPDSYQAIVKEVAKLMASDNEYDSPDPENIKELDFGHYQGSLVYVIPAGGYQPSDFWYVIVGYGSCSGCDTLEAIRGYSDDAPTPEQVGEYMTLALHIVQGLKKMGEEV